MYGPLLERWNMLAVDNRGTGPLDAAALPRRFRNSPAPTGTAAFQRTVGECGEALNHRWRYPRRQRFVHASDLFTSAPAAEDLAGGDQRAGAGQGRSLRRLLRLVLRAGVRGPLPSSGAQLDARLDLRDLGLDPWYRSSIGSMPADFEAACEPRAGVRGGGAASRPGRGSVRSRRACANTDLGTVPGPAGKLQKVTMGVVGLADLVNDAAEDRQIYRELDAAARALLEAGDAAPLLRLYAQRLAVDEAYFGLPDLRILGRAVLRRRLPGLPAAVRHAGRPVGCAPPSSRAPSAGAPAGHLQSLHDRRVAGRRTRTRRPTPAAWTGPRPTSPSPRRPARRRCCAHAAGAGARRRTRHLDAARRTCPKCWPQLGGHARFVELANSTHVVGEGETICGSALIQAFVARPQELDAIDAVLCRPRCLRSMPSASIPRASRESRRSRRSPGTNASTSDLRLAAAAVETAGDAIARYAATEASLDHGLDGGTVTATQGRSGAHARPRPADPRHRRSAGRSRSRRRRSRWTARWRSRR